MSMNLMLRVVVNRAIRYYKNNRNLQTQKVPSKNRIKNPIQKIPNNNQLGINNRIESLTFWDQLIQNAQKKQNQQTVRNSPDQGEYERQQQPDIGVQQVRYNANLPAEDYMSSYVLKKLGKDVKLLSVFDGHGGPQLAEYCSTQKIRDIVEKSIFDLQQKQDFQQRQDEYIKFALCQAYEKLEEDFYQNTFLPQLQLGNKTIHNVGACGLTALIYGNKIYIANAGDSQAIILKHSDKPTYIKCNNRLSVNNPKQIERLKKQFPEDERIIVEENNNTAYLKGRLQPTKTLGDFYLKKQQHYRIKDKNGKVNFRGPYLTCTPEITVFEIDSSFQFLIIASDGVWDVLSKAEIINALYKDMDKAQTESTEAESVASQSLNPSQKSVQNLANRRKQNSNENKSSITEMILNEVLKKTAKNFRKTYQQILQIQAPRRRNYHDDISIIVADLRRIHQ